MEEKNTFLTVAILLLILSALLASGFFIRRFLIRGNWLYRLGEERGSIPKPAPELPELNVPGKSPLVKRIKLLTKRGGRVSWSPDGKWIAFDRLGRDGYYDVWLMNPDGSDQRCLTCSVSNLPQLNNGNPTWHPSGEFLAFQSQDPKLEITSSKLKPLAKLVTGPGGGINNNLWVMGLDGSRFWQLTDIKDGMAVLQPRFSHDGSRLVWAEREVRLPEEREDPWDGWAIKIADFKIVDGMPQLSDIRELTPGEMQFYETLGFSVDDTKVIFAAFPRGASVSTLDIFSYDLPRKKLENLTSSRREWDGCAQFSPDGTQIVWASSQGVRQARSTETFPPTPPGRSDLWLMNPDGSGKEQLTFFNEPNTPEYVAAGIRIADLSFNPDGKYIVVAVELSPIGSNRKTGIVVIEFGK